MAAEVAGADLRRRPLDALEKRLGELLGLSLPECAPEGVLPRLRYRIQDRALDGPEAYAEYLLHSDDPAAWEALAETLTANESRVFGSPGDFAPLLDAASDPGGSRARIGAGPYRCLSAGCGTGEEAYSLAIALAEIRSRDPSFAFEVIGVDLSARAVAKARRGIYPASRGDSIPRDLRDRYFLTRDDEIVATPLQSQVRFARLNLCESDSLLPLGSFDLILARGFLPSLTGEGRRTALENMTRALEPGGVLLLGPGDSIGETDLGLCPVRWGGRHAYERPSPGPSVPRLEVGGDAPDPDLALVAHRSTVARAWVRILLEQRGLRVEEAPHGVGALERAATGRPPSLFLLERTLPPRGGEWVAERLPGLGVVDPRSILYLSPSEAGPASLGLPLTRRSLDEALARERP